LTRRINGNGGQVAAHKLHMELGDVLTSEVVDRAQGQGVIFGGLKTPDVLIRDAGDGTRPGETDVLDTSGTEGRVAINDRTARMRLSACGIACPMPSDKRITFSDQGCGRPNRLLKFTQPSTPAEQREKMTASPDEQ